MQKGEEENIPPPTSTHFPLKGFTIFERLPLGLYGPHDGQRCCDGSSQQS